MFKKILKTGIFLAILSVVFRLADFCYAQDDYGLNIGNNLLLGSTDPRIVAINIIRIILSFLGLLAVGLIIFAGFLWMTSAGDESKVERAKKIIINAIIGIIIILSSLAIATYVINRLSQATGGGGGGGGGGSGRYQAGSGLSGAGVLGACSVEAVYPFPGQKDVVRNTLILITFKEEIDPASLCAGAAGGVCNGGELLPDSARIYKTADGSDNYLSGVRVFSSPDQKSFIFSPAEYLGSASEDVSYSVHLFNNIIAVTGVPAFANCGADFMEWSFEVSNNLDLTPPQIKENGIWPEPDNASDEPADSPAVRATGRITVISQPSTFAAAMISDLVNVAGPSAGVLVDENSNQTGNLSLIVLPDRIKGQLRNNTTGLSLGTANFNIDGEIVFPGILTLRVDDQVENGNFWTMTAQAAVLADTITVGREVYVFVSGAAGENQISVGVDRIQTAANIAAVITDHPDINAASTDNIINITAAVAGATGNNIALSSSDSSRLSITPLSGGADAGSGTITRGGRKDKPMNSIIKINFNESIMPAMVVGTASEVSARLRVINNIALNAVDGTACSNDLDCRSFNCVSGACESDQLSGNFKIANQYKTVEFISNKECGVNGCGEPIYCLPAGGNIRVEIQAASLASCTSDTDCLSKSPYNNCGGGVCRNGDGEAYPRADSNSLDGLVDASLNSLDGNRDSRTSGPISFYYENLPMVTDGDNFVWTFFISDRMEIGAPVITAISPGPNASGAALRGDVEITFNKLMSASSLKTGSTVAVSGDNEFIHKNINLWSLSGFPIGYWIESSDIDTDFNSAVDGCKVFIKHGEFGETLDYRAQVGSGVRDAYQNCYKPSSGPGCSASEVNPSCCNGNPTAELGEDGNCN